MVVFRRLAELTPEAASRSLFRFPDLHRCIRYGTCPTAIPF